MTEAEVQKMLALQYCLKKRHEITVPNIKTCHGWWESDLLSLTRSLLTHEFEIKCSRSDWLKEHNELSTQKDSCKAQRFISYSDQFENQDDDMRVANYFWYVCYDACIAESEIPSYAGLISIHKRFKDGPYTLNVIKKAPRIHSFKASDHIIMSMSRSLSMKHWGYKQSW